MFSMVVGKEIDDRTEKSWGAVGGDRGGDQSPGTNSALTGSE